jgi:hypothetical protein
VELSIGNGLNDREAVQLALGGIRALRAMADFCKNYQMMRLCDAGYTPQEARPAVGSQSLAESPRAFFPAPVRLPAARHVLGIHQNGGKAAEASPWRCSHPA